MSVHLHLIHETSFFSFFLKSIFKQIAIKYEMLYTCSLLISLIYHMLKNCRNPILYFIVFKIKVTKNCPHILNPRKKSTYINNIFHLIFV